MCFLIVFQDVLLCQRGAKAEGGVSSPTAGLASGSVNKPWVLSALPRVYHIYPPFSFSYAHHFTSGGSHPTLVRFFLGQLLQSLTLLVSQMPKVQGTQNNYLYILIYVPIHIYSYIYVPKCVYICVCTNITYTHRYRHVFICVSNYNKRKVIYNKI